MSDEKFFSQVKSSLEHYAPEAPATVYDGMRKKLWWSNFTRLSIARLNMWTILLLLGAMSAVWFYSNSGTAAAIVAKPQVIKPELTNSSPVISQEENLASSEQPSETVEHATAPTASAPSTKKVGKSSKTRISTLSVADIMEPTEEVVTGPVVMPEGEIITTKVESGDSVTQPSKPKKHKKMSVDVIGDTLNQN
jgi:hypothetical protein